MDSMYTWDDISKLVRLTVEKGKVAKRGFPSVRSETNEEYTEFQILIDASMNMREAAAYIAANILIAFEPASKKVYWRIFPEVHPFTVFYVSDKERKNIDLIKFYARLLITDKEETHENRNGELVRIEAEVGQHK